MGVESLTPPRRPLPLEQDGLSERRGSAEAALTPSVPAESLRTPPETSRPSRQPGEQDVGEGEDVGDGEGEKEGEGEGERTTGADSTAAEDERPAASAKAAAP